MQMQLGEKQVPAQGGGIVEVNNSKVIVMTPAIISNNSISIGMAKLSGAYPHAAYAHLNGLEEIGIPCTVLADHDANICAIQLNEFSSFVEVNYKLYAKVFWKKGVNPKGQTPCADIIL